MSITFKEADKNGLISSEIIKMIPKRCLCGSELTISDSFKTLRCINSNCKQQLVNRIQRTLNKIGIVINCDDTYILVNKLKLISPYQVFDLKKAYENNIISNSDIDSLESIINKLEDFKNKAYKLYEIVELCGIESIELISEKLFRNFNSIDEIYVEIDTAQVSFINERLGINTSDSAIMALEIYNILLDIKEELIYAEYIFKVEETKNRFVFAFNDNIIPYVNKNELIEYLEYTYGINICYVTVVTDNTDIIVKNSSCRTTKTRAASIINDMFIADEINNGRLELNDINKKIDNKIKPLGSKIYVDTLNNIIERFEKVYKGADTR